MKLIDNILKKFGYVKESQGAAADLDFVLNLFNIKSVEELRLQKADFKILCGTIMQRDGIGNKDKIVARQELNAGEISSLQDKIETLMLEEGFSCKFEDLPKKKRQELFVLAMYGGTDDAQD